MRALVYCVQIWSLKLALYSIFASICCFLFVLVLYLLTSPLSFFFFFLFLFLTMFTSYLTLSENQHFVFLTFLLVTNFLFLSCSILHIIYFLLGIFGKWLLFLFFFVSFRDFRQNSIIYLWLLLFLSFSFLFSFLAFFFVFFSTLSLFLRVSYILAPFSFYASIIYLRTLTLLGSDPCSM